MACVFAWIEFDLVRGKHVVRTRDVDAWPASLHAYGGAGLEVSLCSVTQDCVIEIEIGNNPFQASIFLL